MDSESDAAYVSIHENMCTIKEYAVSMQILN